MLYSPEGFEPLTDEPWDEQRVRAAIRAIVADTDDAYDRLWPANEWDAWQMPVPLKDVYAGAAGIVWALDVLRRDGHAEPRTDLAAVLDRALELWRAEPSLMAGIELPSTPEASLLCGEAGILLVASRVAPSAARADRLFELVRINVANEAQELMWGAPGTMLAAHALHTWTGEERWAEARRESAEALLAGREEDGLSGRSTCMARHTASSGRCTASSAMSTRSRRSGSRTRRYGATPRPFSLAKRSSKEDSRLGRRSRAGLSSETTP